MLVSSRQQRVTSELRNSKLKDLVELKSTAEELKSKLRLLEENNPQVIAELEKNVHYTKVGANRWTDNVFNLKSWVVNKKNFPSAEVDKWLGIKDDFDYFE